TKALSVLLLGSKEYYALARIHSHVSVDKLKQVMEEFTGEIYQRPPQRSSVRRVTRVRTVYEFDYLENHDRLVLMRVLCQAAAYWSRSGRAAKGPAGGGAGGCLYPQRRGGRARAGGNDKGRDRAERPRNRVCDEAAYHEARNISKGVAVKRVTGSQRQGADRSRP